MKNKKKKPRNKNELLGTHISEMAKAIFFKFGMQGRSQDFLKGGSSTSIELLEAGGTAPSRWETFNILINQNSANYYILCKKYINYDALSSPGMKVVLDKVT